MNNRRDDREFFTLLCRVCDGTAAAEDFAQLEGRLTGNPDARRDYLNFVAMHSDLATEGSGGEWATAEEVIADWGVETRRPPVPRGITSGRALHHSPTLVFALVALVFYGTFAFLAWNVSSRDGGQFREVAEEEAKQVDMVAKLVGDEGCTWRHDSQLAVGSDIPPGPLQLVSGTAELEFTNGARVILEGPTRLTPQEPGRAVLERGKLFARVPRRAIGFTIETPTATIVDLGTEFGVEADVRGATEVEVFKGKVELRPGGQAKGSSASPPTTTLAAGQSRRIESDGDGNVRMSEVPAIPGRFASQLPQNKVRQLRVEGALASSTAANPDFDVRYLIHGHGLSGDQHSNASSKTMWLSSLGKVKNEYVLFDLGHPYRIDSVKVWNFNESTSEKYRFAGVKQADIYVSISGRDDPLKRADEWKLIAENQRFSPGDGTSTYGKPTSVSFGGADARFVAIVVDEALGVDPKIARPFDKFETLHFGTLSPLTGVSSLDLSGTFSYALALGCNDKTRMVSGVAFTDPNKTVGVKLDMVATGFGGVSPEFGADADNNALEEILKHNLFTKLPSLTGSIELTVSPGNRYKLQLLYNETHADTIRVQNLSVNGSPAVTRLVQRAGMPRVFSHEFVSPGNTLSLEFAAGANAKPGEDVFTHVDALTLELMSDSEVASPKEVATKRNAEDAQPDVVGLSEVQFFGSRVKSTSPSIPRKNE